MIERNILSQKMKEFKIREFVSKKFMKTGYSHTKIQRTPLGDKVTIYTSRPGLVVGRKGQNINRLTAVLKKRFNMENPQIEIGEIENPYFDAQSISEKMAYALEKLHEFKGITVYGSSEPRGTISFNVEGSQKSVISGTSKSSDFEHQNSQSFNAPKPHDGFDGKKASEGKEAD